MEHNKTPFYKVENPTTEQFIQAIENMDYFTIDQLEKKRNQLRVYFQSLWGRNSEVMISYFNVTNSGGYPIIFSDNNDIAQLIEDFNGEPMTYEEIEEESELFFSYASRL